MGRKNSGINAKDISGQRFGRLVALERAENIGRRKGRPSGRVAFLFQCDCGKRKVIAASNVARGSTLSCGCYQAESARELIKSVRGGGKKKHGLSGTKYSSTAGSANKRAKKHGDSSRLGVAEVKEVLESCGGYCYYCGNKPDTLSLDHVVPLSRGGKNVKENCKPSCIDCNRRKKDTEPTKFIEKLEIELWLKNLLNW